MLLIHTKQDVGSCKRYTFCAVGNICVPNKSRPLFPRLYC